MARLQGGIPPEIRCLAKSPMRQCMSITIFSSVMFRSTRRRLDANNC